MQPWLARILDRPGATSFRAERELVVEAGRLEPWARSLSNAELAEAARAAARTGTASPAAALLATLRAAAERTLRQRPFDEQLLTCAALLRGHAVELDTGEGKTLAGALAAVGFALAGRRVHVLSVNDYLARRDAAWMAPLIETLGLAVGWIGQRSDPDARRGAYACDVVYAPATEVGYDVLRDRLATDEANRVRPMLDVAIVDEIDAVLVDQAMAPLVLAGATPDDGADIATADELVRALDLVAHCVVDAEEATAWLTDDGLDAVERSLGGVNLYDAQHTPTLTRINLALHAHALVRRDVDYLVVDGAIRLVDAAKGRIAHLQRWPDGLHAAVEAKERLAISSPGLVLDSLTLQDLALGYATLAGMSGTVLAVADELLELHALRSGRVGPRLPIVRVDHPQQIFVLDGARIDAVLDEVKRRHAVGQPVLVGTQSVEQSERLGEALAGVGLAVQVLNARNDADEAAIIARAGELGAVTISTQISGRGTDIRLGGADERDRDRVVALGGLAVLAVGRHPSSRLDAQLRGRSGRQGDPGLSMTFVSVDEELVRTHAAEHDLEQVRRRGTAMSQAALRSIADGAQRIAEGVRRDRHRATWDYTRAISLQRTAVLARRDEVLRSDATTAIESRFPHHVAALVEAAGEPAVAALVREATLWALDDAWSAHLADLAQLRDGIHLEALAGADPRQRFHEIALRAFEGFSDRALDAAADVVSRVTPDGVGDGLEGVGIRRPSATWTYMVRDEPLGTPGDRAVRTLGRWWRSNVLGAGPHRVGG